MLWAYFARIISTVIIITIIIEITFAVNNG